MAKLSCLSFSLKMVIFVFVTILNQYTESAQAAYHDLVIESMEVAEGDNVVLHVKGEVQSRITIISKERVKISLQIGAKMMKIG